MWPRSIQMSRRLSFFSRLRQALVLALGEHLQEFLDPDEVGATGEREVGRSGVPQDRRVDGRGELEHAGSTDDRPECPFGSTYLVLLRHLRAQEGPERPAQSREDDLLDQVAGVVLGPLHRDLAADEVIDALQQDGEVLSTRPGVLRGEGCECLGDLISDAVAEGFVDVSGGIRHDGVVWGFVQRERRS